MIIEKEILRYLENGVGLPCFFEYPTGKGLEEFIILERIGGSRSNHVSKGILAVKSHAPTMQRASEINDIVKNVLFNASIVNVGGIYLNSDYNFTDTSKKGYRYQAVFEITYV